MDIIIRNSGGIPIYDQITRQVKGLILRGELREGEALPSMRLLAKELRISVITTKRAYEELERDGFLTTIPGKGCFVAPRNLELVREDTLRRMEEKGLVKAETAGRTRHYTPAVERRGAAARETRSFLNKVYQGSVGLMVSAMAQDKALSQDEIDALYEILRKAEGKES